jgi:chemotaxis protein CheD
MAYTHVTGPLVKIGLAQFRVAKAPMTMVTMALGSCLGVILYDETTCIGGLAHVMHPKRELVKNNANKAKFVDSAITLMLGRMIKRGARREKIVAKIFGGAKMFKNIVGSPGVLQIGEKNIESAREKFAELDIPIAAEDVGGNQGRTISFNVSDGTVLLRDSHDNEKVY